MAIPGFEDARQAAARLKVTVQHAYSLNSSRDDFPKAVCVGLIPVEDRSKVKCSKNYRRSSAPVTGAYRSHLGVITSKAKSEPFAKRRARAEHSIARLKDFEVLRRHRRRGETLNDTTRAIAVLHSLKIDCAWLRKSS